MCSKKIVVKYDNFIHDLAWRFLIKVVMVWLCKTCLKPITIQNNDTNLKSWMMNEKKAIIRYFVMDQRVFIGE